MSRIDFHNSTHLVDAQLLALFNAGLSGWAVGTLRLFVRYSRGADFSGTCYYSDRRIYVNLGRHLVYPYAMDTNVARAKTNGRYWWKPTCTLALQDGYQLATFIFMHELYHLLVKRARRNVRRKESMCDRFAARFLVEQFGLTLRGPDGRHIPRHEWDFQDLDGFVAAARDRRASRSAAHGNRPAARHVKRGALAP